MLSAPPEKEIDRTELAADWYYLAVKLTKQFWDRIGAVNQKTAYSKHFMECFSDATWSLVRAANRYNPEHGSFYPFAASWINGGLLKGYTKRLRLRERSSQDGANKLWYLEEPKDNFEDLVKGLKDSYKDVLTKWCHGQSSISIAHERRCTPQNIQAAIKKATRQLKQIRFRREEDWC